MQLRYFFDPGSGVCLWAGDDAARDAFGYAVAFEDLSLSPDTVAIGNELLQEFDGSIDWNDPGSPSPWSTAQMQGFSDKAHAFLSRLRAELGGGFEIIDALGSTPNA